MINWNLIDHRSSKLNSRPEHHATLVYKPPTFDYVFYTMNIRPVAPSEIFNASEICVGFSLEKVFISTSKKGTPINITGSDKSKRISNRDFVRNALMRLCPGVDLSRKQNLRVSFVQVDSDTWEIVKY